MIKVMLVDDEILALEYLKKLIDWESRGYQLVATATSGRVALEQYHKTLPEIVITDIKMSGMDGLELARQLKTQDPGVIVIFLSAYRDFKYAQQGLLYGVSNYLLKHELNLETLLEALQKTAEQVEQAKKRRNAYQAYWVKQLVSERQAEVPSFVEEMGDDLVLLIVHKGESFCSGEFIRAKRNLAEAGVFEAETPRIEAPGVRYVAGAPLTPDNWVILCRCAETSGMQSSDEDVRTWAQKLSDRLERVSDGAFYVLCSRKLRREQIKHTVEGMSQQMQRAFFWKPYSVRFYEPVSTGEERMLWGDEIKKLEYALYHEEEEPGKIIHQLLDVLKDEQHAASSRSLLWQIYLLLAEASKKAGIAEESSAYKSVDEVISYYERRFDALHRNLCDKSRKKYSLVVAKTISYIRKNYQKKLSLEILGAEVHMNGVYLGQLFKKEVGISILKFQTLLRIDEAKRLLREENRTVSETAQLVGYQTSQYFSQIFVRNTGKTPQEYRNKG